MDRRPYIATYIMASRPLGVLYVGASSNLYQRAHQHREGLIPGFTMKHACKMLVWYEPHEIMITAIKREKALKRWNRSWKLELIERTNPNWTDLFDSLCGTAPDPRVKPEDDEGKDVLEFLTRLPPAK